MVLVQKRLKKFVSTKGQLLVKKEQRSIWISEWIIMRIALRKTGIARACAREDIYSVLIFNYFPE